jgi:hypothetical protein
MRARRLCSVYHDNRRGIVLDSWYDTRVRRMEIQVKSGKKMGN